MVDQRTIQRLIDVPGGPRSGRGIVQRPPQGAERGPSATIDRLQRQGGGPRGNVPSNAPKGPRDMPSESRPARDRQPPQQPRARRLSSEQARELEGEASRAPFRSDPAEADRLDLYIARLASETKLPVAVLRQRVAQIVESAAMLRGEPAKLRAECGDWFANLFAAQ